MTVLLVMRGRLMVLTVALEVIRVLQVAAVSQGLEQELQARVVPPVRRL
jgi:hypothetical protein